MMDNNQTILHSATDPNATVMARKRTPYQPPKKKGSKALVVLLVLAGLFLLLTVLGVAGFFVAKHYWFAGTEEANTEQVQRELSVDEAIDELSGLNLSLSAIQEIERRVDRTATVADEMRLNRRLMALKHLYANEFLREDHRVQNLRNIYMLYSTDFSEEQRNTLKWFLNLPNSQQILWEYVEENVNDFNDFRQKMEAEMGRR